MEKHQKNAKKDNAASTSSTVRDFTSIDRNSNSNSNINRRPYLQTQMSRRTVGRTDNNDLHNKTGDKKTTISTGVTPSRSDTESQSEEDEVQNQGKHKLLVEWTEDDQRNLMDLGSSEIERNKRLESLIAKRKARKLYSMQPRRNNYYDLNVDDYLDNQIMGSILVSKGGIDDNGDHQPGSAPCVLLPTRNPFDLPYDPHEEKPVLTGGSFDEDFFPDAQQQERINEMADELSMMKEVKSSQIQKHNQDEASTSRPREEEVPKLFENPFAINNKIIGSNEPIACARDEAQPTQDHVVLLDCKGCVNDDVESSSSSSSEVTSFNAAKNEAFRNSVRKVLTCLAFPKNKGLVVRENIDATPSDLPDLLASVTSPTNDIPTKMQERSYYTKPHHTSNFSIASDMQVEVSEAGSPTTQTNEASSPTDQESYDGDVDKDVNSADDEELWGASPHPSKLGEFGMNFKLHDITEEKEHKGSNLSSVVHNNERHTPPTLMEEESGDHEARVMGVVSSLSPRSILPDEDKKNDVVDLKSTNGDIMESRSSGSSEGLTSQMQSKAEHLAVYLASLPPSPSESGSNILEDMESSHVREPSAEETFPDEIIDASYEVDENKEESRESKELEGSQGSSEESTTTSQIEALKETSSTFNEFNGGELKKEHVDHQDSSITEQNEHSRRNEGKGESLTSNENEVIYSPKEAISDSFSTTCQEDTYEHLRLEEDMKFTQLGVQSEVTDDLLRNQIIHDDESTSKEEKKVKADNVIDHSNNTKSEVIREDEPQLKTAEHDGAVLSSSIEAELG